MVRPNEPTNWNGQAGGHAREDAFRPTQEPSASGTQSPNSTSPRRRSVSVASAQPSVETVVSKAKRAASNLWTLLHAQHCTIAEGCIHRGCKDAKLLLLHMKVCSAGGDFSCPTNHRGCDQGRKLLAHYKRCKSIRAKQVGQAGAARRDPAQQHSCLVCTLVARQARSILEHRPRPPHSVGASGPVASATSTAVRKTSSRKIISSFMLDNCNRVVTIPSETLLASPKIMPPPPPRARVGVLSEEESLLVDTSASYPKTPSYGSYPPPSMAQGTVKSVSFYSSRGRALSQSEASPEASVPSRPRSQSLGSALTSHRECDTIAEEGDPPEQPTNYDAWNPAV